MEYGNGKKNNLVWQNTKNRYHKDSELIEESNENVNIAILSREVKLGSCVLDIGCGEGKLGRILSKKNCSLYGIEIDDAAANYALNSGNYKNVFCLNFETTDCLDIEDESGKKLEVDYVALIDVLEHVINPTKVLLNAAEYLNEGGKILISVPNINNGDIILNLLDGKFNYQEAGILDNTHTKYFTKSSFVEWIQEINKCDIDVSFECKYVGAVYGYTEYLDNIKVKMPLVYDFIQLNPQFNVIQNLFVLEKRQKESINENLLLLAEEKQVSLVQVLNQYLIEGMNEKFMLQMAGVKMLRNERNILEQRCISAEQGWVECDRKLQEAMQGWRTCQKKLEEVEQCLNSIMNVWKKHYDE